MVRYLSAEWVAELDAVLRSSAGAPAVDAPVIIQQHVAGSPASEWFLRLGPDGVTATPGRAPDPTVELCQGIDTAMAVARGHLSAEEALLTGRIRVRGDVAALVAPAPRDALRELAAALGRLRDRTEFPDVA